MAASPPWSDLPCCNLPRCPAIIPQASSVCYMFANDFATTGINAPCNSTVVMTYDPAPELGPVHSVPTMAAAIVTFNADTPDLRREELVFTLACAYWQISCMVLSHFSLSWLLHDIIPGQRRALMAVQVSGCPRQGLQLAEVRLAVVCSPALRLGSVQPSPCLPDSSHPAQTAVPVCMLAEPGSRRHVAARSPPVMILAPYTHPAPPPAQTCMFCRWTMFSWAQVCKPWLCMCCCRFSAAHGGPDCLVFHTCSHVPCPPAASFAEFNSSMRPAV
jgi:hypothetical protein